LEGSPALTFSPLPAPQGDPSASSLWARMERRYEAYKSHVVKPFFRDHFARLDRQIVLVDALAAINGGPETAQDLEHALAEILASFRPGAGTSLSRMLFRRIDRILFAATKADHLHHTSHDRLEAILATLTHSAIERAQFAGAEIDVLALASVRATREGIARISGEELPVIIGHPLPGEHVGKRKFDGTEEYAVFPGDLPEDPAEVLEPASGRASRPSPIEMVRFRPPDTGTDQGRPAALPHIRLDRAMNFLIGDRLE
ncbi:MAG: YcjX family protein, partial [Pseudomonadota bacterium]|nr:YcjX family protein [Pseudomonadota bacterium]